MNNILLFMNLSGSVALVLYYLFKALLGRYLSASFRYLLLKLSMCFFLLPVPLLSGDIRVLIRKVLPAYSLNSETWEKRIYDLDKIIYDTPHGYQWGGDSWIFICLLSAWVIITAGILLMHRRNYRKLKQMTEDLAETDDQLSETMQNLQSEIHIRKKISTCTLTKGFPPFCYGFFKPKIAIPKGYDSEAEEMFLRHELYHIKSLDFFTRMLGLLIIAFHFFNPMAYLLFYEIGRACELACDEKVISVYSEEQRKRYGFLLLDHVITSPLLSYGNPFSGNNKHSIKERISMIKQPKKPKFTIFILCALSIFLFSTLSVAAYELPRIEERSSLDPIVVPDWYMFSTESCESFTDPNEHYFEHADCFFIDEDGNVTFDIENSASPQSICSHTYVSGRLYDHLAKPSGGCVYSVYSCKRCSKCGATKDKTLVSTTTYASCPHGSV